MHGWEKMCGFAMSGAAYPTIISRHVASRTPVTSAFRELHVPRRVMNGLRSFGVIQLEDLMDLRMDDLAEVGMTARQQSRFMQALWDDGPIRTSLDPGIRNSTPLRELVGMLRMLAFRRSFHDLGVRTAADLGSLTGDQLSSLNVSRLQRRRIHLAAEQALKVSTTVKKVSVRELLDRLRKPLQRAKGPPGSEAPEWAPAAKSSSTVDTVPGDRRFIALCDVDVDGDGEPDMVKDCAKATQRGSGGACDCSWTNKPNCRGQRDDFTRCWALCCPKRGPRYGDWNLTRAAVRQRRALAKNAIW